MLFTAEDLCLDHLPCHYEGFDPEEFMRPKDVWPNISFSSFPKRPNNITEELGSNFIDQEWHTSLRLTQIAWQAFFDEIKFDVISDDSQLEFFTNIPDLTEVDPEIPAVVLRGNLGRKIYCAFSDLKAVNDGTLSFDRFIQNGQAHTIIKLLNNGYLPDSFTNVGLVLTREPIRIRLNQKEVLEARRLLKPHQRRAPG